MAMTVFVVLTPGDSADIDAAVATAFASNFIKVGAGQWLVAANGMTPREVTALLGGPDGRYGNILVLGVGGFWGWQPKTVWEWIQTKMAV